MEPSVYFSDADCAQVALSVHTIREIIEQVKQDSQSPCAAATSATNFATAIKNIAAIIFGKELLDVPWLTLRIPVIAECNPDQYDEAKRLLDEPCTVEWARNRMHYSLFDINYLMEYDVVRTDRWREIHIVFVVTMKTHIDAILLEMSYGSASMFVFNKYDCDARRYRHRYSTKGTYRKHYVDGHLGIHEFKFGEKTFIVKQGIDKHYLLAGSTPHFCPK